MARALTLLLLSAGRRVALLECFRRAAGELGIGLRVLACDVEPELSAACHAADASFRVPRCDGPGYVEAVIEAVRREGVGLVVPTIDTELAPLAACAGCFAELGVRLHVSDAAVIEKVRNKARTMSCLAEAGVPTPWTAPFDAVLARPADTPWPLFLKPSGGSAGRGAIPLRRLEDAPARFDERMIAQELLEGPEYTVNLFVDLAGTLRAAIPHRRIRVRAGEVEKGRTERREDLAEIACGVVRALPGLRGAACFQVIDDRRKGPCVFEVNARFGGGYPLAERAGGTFARWLLEETAGLPCSARDAWRSGVTMLRYDAAVFVDGAP